MQNTKNYSLLLPDGTDFYNVNDSNRNFETIDVQMKSNQTKADTVTANHNSHVANKSNPHGVTKEQIGLGNVPNVTTNNQTPTYTVPGAMSELASGETVATAFGKLARAVLSLISHIGNTNNPHGVTKAQIGLGSVPNVSTNEQKPTYTVATNLSDLNSGEVLSSALAKTAKAISTLISHIADSVSHITSAERTAWNAKLDRRGDTMSGKLRCNDAVEVCGAGDTAKGLKIMRNNSETECVFMRIEDGKFNVHYVNDEITSQVVFTLENTDTEAADSDREEANVSMVVLSGSADGSYVTAKEFRGLAASATKLQTPRTIALTGGASGSASFDGSANASIAVTVADDSHNHIISNVDGLQTKLQSVDKDISDLKTLTNRLEDSLADGVLKFGWSSGTKELVVIINGTTVGSIPFGAAG